jgi:hypothetical protein
MDLLRNTAKLNYIGSVPKPQSVAAKGCALFGRIAVSEGRGSAKNIMGKITKLEAAGRRKAGRTEL